MLGVLPPRYARRQDDTSHYFFFTASSAIDTFTSSPRRKPPWSRALFQLRPKSLRFSVVSTSKPARSLPHGSLAKPRKVTGSVTSFVTPCSVRLPVTL